MGVSRGAHDAEPDAPRLVVAFIDEALPFHVIYALGGRRVIFAHSLVARSAVVLRTLEKLWLADVPRDV
eukprot:2817362-Lingulodinium_polyedra.AAC.1